MTYKIILRDCKWFDSGDSPNKDSSDLIYAAKQKLKRLLNEITPTRSLDELKKALSSVPEIAVGFRGRPYLEGREIMIEATSGPAGKEYLGDVVGSDENPGKDAH